MQEPLNYSQIFIIGASGFVGKYLIAELKKVYSGEIAILLRDKKDKKKYSGIKTFYGDLNQEKLLSSYILRDALVINLAYSSFEDNEVLTYKLLRSCKESKIKRFVHLSTATIAGRTAVDYVNEMTVPMPLTKYEVTKYNLEQIIQRELTQYKIEHIIIRPTVIFGIGGLNLNKLFNQCKNGNRISNYARLCLQKNRKLNLVSINMVISSLIFLISIKMFHLSNVYIVSNDEELLNNYEDVVSIFNDVLGNKKLNIPLLNISWLLKIILLLKGRSCINLKRNYSSQKLINEGWKYPKKNFREELLELAYDLKNK